MVQFSPESCRFMSTSWPFQRYIWIIFKVKIKTRCLVTFSHFVLGSLDWFVHVLLKTDQMIFSTTFSIPGNWPTPSDKMVLTYFCCVGNTCLWHFVQNIFADYKIYFVLVTYLYSHDSNGRVRKWVAKRTWAKATLFTIIILYCWKWHWINRSIKHEKGKTGIWWEKGYSLN